MTSSWQITPVWIGKAMARDSCTPQRFFFASLRSRSWWSTQALSCRF